MRSSVKDLLVAASLGVVMACGGTALVPPDGEQSEGGEGGDTSGAGGNTGGSGGSVGGSGGSVAGSGGSIAGAGGGGSGGGTPTCVPPPSCNWCGGGPRYDENNCLVGYVCANGADPCSTQPCSGPNDCKGGEICQDMLCWPGGEPTCFDPMGECAVSGGPAGESTCACKWSCNDGSSYMFDCTVTNNSLSCDCAVNGTTIGSCGGGVAGGGGGGPPPDACGANCCGFPGY